MAAKRVDWPIWVLIVVICSVGLGGVAIGFLLRLIAPDDQLKSKILASLAMSSAVGVLRDQGQLKTPQAFTVTRPFTISEEVAGFTIQPLKDEIYLVRSDDKKILILLQQKAGGTDRKCLVHPSEIQGSACLLGE